MDAEISIDLGALSRNVARLAALARPALYAAVVKANAYGHGLTEVGRALDRCVDGFCVYRLDEAVTLRDAGARKPVLVLGPVAPEDLAEAYARDVAIALWDDGAFALDVARAAGGEAPFMVHAKIDTGVTRLGLQCEGAASVLAGYLANSALDVRGVFTHLAAAEELESEFTLAQLFRFQAALAPLGDVLAARGVVRHAAASAAAILYPALRLDLVRPGIATYGIWPSAQTREAAVRHITLEPALSWRTRLVVVRDVEAGTAVGYGCTYETSRPSRIGVLPIGYAEGLPRALSNAGSALVAGTRVPFIGRICMNMSFVDVTDAPGAHCSSPVTLIGSDGAQCIDANELAAAAGTIGYEIVARLPREMQRCYTNGPLLPQPAT